MRNVAHFTTPEPRSSGSGTVFGYMVECRHSYRDPIIIAGKVYDKDWREITFTEGGAGVPSRQYSHAREHGLIDYTQAQALRWWFLADCEANAVLGRLCLETRIVEYRITYTNKVEAIGYSDAQDFHGDVPPDMVPPPAINDEARK